MIRKVVAAPFRIGLNVTRATLRLSFKLAGAVVGGVLDGLASQPAEAPTPAGAAAEPEDATY